MQAKKNISQKVLHMVKNFNDTLFSAGIINSINNICQCFETEALWPWNYQTREFPSTLNGKPWPKISIVTPSYNNGTFIEETIRSVVLQGYPNLEYIVIDGGSKDNTLKILKRYKSEISICISEPDNGQSNALNKGFNLATGEILAWLNSDDLYLPDTLRDVAIAFDSQTIDMVIGGCHAIKKFSRFYTVVSHHCILPMNRVTLLPYEKLLDFQGSYLKGDFFYQPEVFWTRQIWDKIGSMVDEKLHLSMDYEFWFRLAKAKAIALHIPETLAVFRYHDQQKTIRNLDVSFFPEHIEVVRQFQEGLRPSIDRQGASKHIDDRV